MTTNRTILDNTSPAIAGPSSRVARRTALAWVAAAIASCATLARAAERVPFRKQAQLLAKVAEYDRNLVAREGTRVVLLVRKSGSATAGAAVEEVAAELSRIDRIAGGPHREFTVEFESAPGLREAIRERNVAIVYLAGLTDGMEAIAKELEGVAVLTAAPSAEDAERGAVLGFDVVSGRVQLVVNLRRAKAQKVAFRSEFLQLARVIR